MAESFTQWLGGKALRDLRRLWRDLAPAAWQGAGRPVHPDLPDGELPQIRRQVSECLRALGGEVSARSRAAHLGETYLGLTPIGRERFLRLLAAEFGTDPAAVDEAINDYLDAEEEDRLTAEARLRAALRSSRVRLLTQFNALPSGVKFLVDLRRDLLAMRPWDRELRALDQDLMDILRSWFDVGFLELRRISWNSPASLLQKLIAYEAVHEIESWDDLRNRLESDRRCYAYFHPSMPEEPLIFVEVALLDRLAGNIQALLDENAPEQDPDEATTAIFYSISNTQAGLRGISFGSFLIKRVVDDLSRQFPRLKHFATLSPIPGFRRWLREQPLLPPEGCLQPNEVKALEELQRSAVPSPKEEEAQRRAGGTAPRETGPHGTEPHAAGPRETDSREAASREAASREAAPREAGLLEAVLDHPAWVYQPRVAEALQPILMRLCARYLLQAKRGNQPLDPVARFHLGNGASIERLNYLADTSSNGLKQSAGIMVNYAYRSDQIEESHEAYRRTGAISASAAIERLARKG